MRFPLIAACLLPFLLTAAGVLRIGNATGGANVGALQGSALKRSLTDETEISIEKCPAADGFAQLEAGKIDLLIAEGREIPKNFSGKRQKWAAEALTLYVPVTSPLRQISSAELRRLMTEDHPLWSRYGGGMAEVQRIALKPDARNGELESRWSGGKARSDRIFRVSSTEQGFHFLNDNSVLLASFSPERPAKIAAVAVDGVTPLIGSVLDGSYPLARVYWLCWLKPTPQLEAFLLEISGNEHVDMVQDSGLLPALRKEKVDEKR